MTLTMTLTINSGLNLIITSQTQYITESQVSKGIKIYMYIYTHVLITRSTMMFYEYVCNTHVHVHVCALYMCVQIYKLACAHCMWRLEVKIGCLSLSLYNLFWRQGL